MVEWLQDSFQGGADVSLVLLITRLTVAFALSCVVAAIYRFTHVPGPGQAAGLTATLVLLTVLIAMVTLVIGNNVARAFSLVGALAIVRFRTVVEDTRDTAFVIFAVAVGMAVGAGFLLVPLVGIPFVALGALLFRPRRGKVSSQPRDFMLKVRIGAGIDPEATLSATFGTHLERSVLASLGTARQGAVFDLTYDVRLREAQGAVILVAALNGLEGVQEVELRRA